MIARLGLDKTARSIVQGARPQLTMAVVAYQRREWKGVRLCAGGGPVEGQGEGWVGLGCFYARVRRPAGSIMALIIEHKSVMLQLWYYYR